MLDAIINTLRVLRSPSSAIISIPVLASLDLSIFPSRVSTGWVTPGISNAKAIKIASTGKTTRISYKPFKYSELAS